MAMWRDLFAYCNAYEQLTCEFLQLTCAPLLAYSEKAVRAALKHTNWFA